MDYIKQIYAHQKNQDYVFSLIETALKEKFNININNIPDINKQIQTYMYKAFCKFKDTYKHLTDREIYNTIDPYDAIDEINGITVKLCLEKYINDFTTKQNLYTNSNTSDNYCDFKEESFNNASTFLTDQQNVQQEHIQNIMMRSVDTDTYFADRASSLSDIYKNQGFDPRKLHTKMVKAYEDNKKKANTIL